MSEYINLQSIELQANEDITEIMVEYNNVSNNFENVIINEIKDGSILC